LEPVTLRYCRSLVFTTKFQGQLNDRTMLVDAATQERRNYGGHEFHLDLLDMLPRVWTRHSRTHLAHSNRIKDFLAPPSCKCPWVDIAPGTPIVSSGPVLCTMPDFASAILVPKTASRLSHNVNPNTVLFSSVAITWVFLHTDFSAEHVLSASSTSYRTGRRTRHASLRRNQDSASWSLGRQVRKYVGGHTT